MTVVSLAFTLSQGSLAPHRCRLPISFALAISSSMPFNLEFTVWTGTCISDTNSVQSQCGCSNANPNADTNPGIAIQTPMSMSMPMPMPMPMSMSMPMPMPILQYKHICKCHSHFRCCHCLKFPKCRLRPSAKFDHASCWPLSTKWHKAMSSLQSSSL